MWRTPGFDSFKPESVDNKFLYPQFQFHQTAPVWGEEIPNQSVDEQSWKHAYGICLYTPSSDPNDCSITPDNVQGAMLATEHLLELGRRSFARISGVATDQASVDRAKGVQLALQGSEGSLIYQTPTGMWSGTWKAT